MSFTGLMRSFKYIVLGAVLVGTVACYFALRTSIPSTAGSPDDAVAESSRFAGEGDGAGTRIAKSNENDGEVDDFVSPLAAPETGAPFPERVHRNLPNRPQTLAIDPLAADPFASLPTASAGPVNRLAPEKLPSGRLTKPAQFDPRETSWENPFVQEYWEGSGWKFESRGMSSEAEGPASAVFRRSYRRLMLESRLELLKEGDSPIHLRLKAPENGALIQISVRGSELQLNDTGRNASRLSERANLEPALSLGKPGLLRLAATGNRFVLSWNGQIVLSCDQPSAQSGRDLQLEWKADATAYRISYLRLEGE